MLKVSAEFPNYTSSISSSYEYAEYKEENVDMFCISDQESTTENLGYTQVYKFKGSSTYKDFIEIH